MTPSELLRKMISAPGGRKLRAIARPGMSEAELLNFVRRLPHPPPDDVIELLRIASGIDFEPIERTPIDDVTFVGDHDFNFEQVFRFALPIGRNGHGNIWIVDIKPETGEWGAVLYVCHDPPVIVVQARDVAEFLEQLSNLLEGDDRAIDQIISQSVYEIGRKNPNAVRVAQARLSDDIALREFAQDLPDDFVIADMRSRDPGIGFSWSGEEPNAGIRRAGNELIFATRGVQESRGFLKRLFSRRES